MWLRSDRRRNYEGEREGKERYEYEEPIRTTKGPSTAGEGVSSSSTTSHSKHEGGERARERETIEPSLFQFGD